MSSVIVQDALADRRGRLTEGGFAGPIPHLTQQVEPDTCIKASPPLHAICKVC